MLNKKHIVVGLGELLWDLFPAGKQLGGAPANFAYITSLLGDRGIPASSIGRDDLGDQAAERLHQLGLPTDSVQRDPEHPTGIVKVEVDPTGQPRFEIAESVAWDFCQWTSQWQSLAQQADAVCFGSLGQRAPCSRATINKFLHATRPDAIRIFDVNLRQHFYSLEVIIESMKLASIIKLNHDELPRIMKLLGLEHRDGNEQESARRLLNSYELDLVCVTRGTAGSLLISPTESTEHPGFVVKVADTVGAGDAFTAAMVHGYLRHRPLAEVNQTANRVGAWVASQPGATPAPSAGDLQQSLAEI
jgi:fructokinase